jgi:hypothetical protein
VLYDDENPMTLSNVVHIPVGFIKKITTGNKTWIFYYKNIKRIKKRKLVDHLITEEKLTELLARYTQIK